MHSMMPSSTLGTYFWGGQFFVLKKVNFLGQFLPFECIHTPKRDSVVIIVMNAMTEAVYKVSGWCKLPYMDIK